MAGSCQRGLYGRSKSPYKQQYMCNAHASGSSYSCRVSTAARLSAFGWAGEAITSGRSPASYNALVACASSYRVIAPRGLCPLYPTCDKVDSHTRTVSDLFQVLNVVVADDNASGDADFRREQQYVPLPKASHIRPADPDALRDRRVVVPKCFIGVAGAKPKKIACFNGVRSPRKKAQKDIKSRSYCYRDWLPLFENYTRQDFPG